MTYCEAIAYMESLRTRGIQPGLSRMEDAARRLAHPERAFCAVHIAGTNGKGSTATMMAAALCASGHRVGLFTSPSVTDIRDTIQIDGIPISKEAFAQAASAVSAVISDGLTEFEWLTMVCFESFRRHGVTVAVIECGLGGAHDATNILPTPLCAVFTPIALDHTGILGDSIETIAHEKSGIIKAGCDVVCASTMHEDALGELYEAAAAVGSRLWQPSTTAAWEVNGIPIALAMRGEHQQQNALTVYTALCRLQANGIAIDMNAAANAVTAVTLPCRLEAIPVSPPLLLDGAHNPHGVAALIQAITPHAPITLILGMLADKNHKDVLAALAPLCRRIVCCTPPNTPRPPMSAESLAHIAREYHRDVVVIEEPVAAYEYVKKAPDTTYIVAGGSFYTAASIRRSLK